MVVAPGLPGPEATESAGGAKQEAGGQPAQMAGGSEAARRPPLPPIAPSSPPGDLDVKGEGDCRGGHHWRDVVALVVHCGHG